MPTVTFGRTILRATSTVLSVVLSVAVLGCTRVAPTTTNESWDGTVTLGDTTVDFELDVRVTEAGAWTGTYTVLATPPYSGDVTATVEGGVLRGTLVATRACTFDLDGTVAGGSLIASFVPTGCPGGLLGTWIARRLGTPRQPQVIPPTPGDVASFGSAVFGTARFR